LTQEPSVAVEKDDGSPIPFDVVSIRRSDPKSSGYSVRPDPNRFVANGVSLSFLIAFAYSLHDFQIIGGPAWMRSERFDLVATMDIPSVEEAQRTRTSMRTDQKIELIANRLRLLLEDRFKLHVHKDSKEMPVLALRTNSGGAKLTPSSTNSGYSEGAGNIRCTSTSMAGLAEMLSDMLDRVVVDQTELRGAYAFALKWTPDASYTPESPYPLLVTALKEQLGLKLASSKAEVDTLVVDNVSLPSDN